MLFSPRRSIRSCAYLQASKAGTSLIALSVLLLTMPTGARAQSASGDVFDQFHRYMEIEHKVFSQEMPGETVDPFTGILRIVQTDLVLPGKAGLDLQIVRAYSSKIWGRADLFDMEPLLAEKEHSVLGYGWTFHMGRVKNPFASGQYGMCSGDFPIYEAPDGSSRVFYPMRGSNNSFISKDFWRLEKNCTTAGGTGVCIWSDNGVRYEFDSSNQYYYGGTTPVWPLSGIVDMFDNRIEVHYLAGTGAVSGVTDTWNRQVTFEYSSDVDGLRLVNMQANGKTYQYLYTTYTSSQTTGAGRLALPGARRFLTEVRPPTGPSTWYEYAYDATVDKNQYGLSGITYPSGGTTTYDYSSVIFFTGRDMVPFSVVTHRSVDGRGVVPGEWSYAYNSPGPGPDMHVTTITRPDGKHDVYNIVGFGYVAGRNAPGYTYGVGLTLEIDRANGAEQEWFDWRPNEISAISPAYYSAPVYSGNCGIYYVWDAAIFVPVLKARFLLRDEAFYTTEYSNFNAYGQAQTVSETGDQGAMGLHNQNPPKQIRNTQWTYLTVPSVNIVRGRPTSRHVCVGNECFDEAWTYNGPGYARDSETVSGVTTTFTHYQNGDLQRVTNARNQSLTLSNYQYGVARTVNFNGAFNVSRAVYWEGWIQSETNGRSYTTRYEYDDIGRIKTVTPPGNSYVTRYTYASDGSQTRLERGSYWRETNLDGLGRTISTLDAEGVRATVKYDAMGRTTFKSYPYDTSIGEVGDKLDFDGLGRMVKQTRAYRPSTGQCETPNACRVMIDYFANCVHNRVERASGNIPETWSCNVSYGDPSEQRLTQVSDAGGKLWEYTYNAFGKLKAVKAPLAQGNRSYNYDPHQFLESETSSESGTFTYERNAIGQMTRRTDGRPATVRYDYTDPLSRLRGITYQSGSDDDVSQDYDDANNLRHIASQNGGTFDYVYDEVNRVTQQTWSYGGRSYVTSYHYNSAGCLDSMTYPSGVTLTMTCDTANRVKTISMGGTAIASNITYHPSGQVKAMTYGNGKTTTVVYDDRARVKSASSTNVVSLSYGYDGADNVVSFDNAAVPDSARTMVYDALDRLVSSNASDQWGSVNYEYDELGNRVKAMGASTSNYQYEAQTNRLVSITGTSTPLPSMTLTWDAAARLAASSDGTTYRYDGRGRRVQKADANQTTVYHYDTGGRVLAETRPDGTKLRDFIYLGNKLIAISGCVEEAGSSTCSGLQWYHTDTLGSVLARTDSAGNVVARFDYQPWGEQWSVPAVQGDRQYNGRVYDPGTGFHDYGARLYWPEIGRFVSVDSAGPSLANPMSFNRYSYTFNNPYKYTDPDGRNPLVVVGLACAGAGFVGSAVASYLANGEVNWNAATQWAAKGFLIGVTAGLGATMLADSEAASATLATAAGAGATAGATVAAGGRHVVLGLERFGLQDVANKVGGETLMRDPNWKMTLLQDIGNAATKFTVSLEGLSGSSNYSKVMSAVQQGLTPAASPLNWELAQLYQAGRLAAVNFVNGAGQALANPFQ